MGRILPNLRPSGAAMSDGVLRAIQHSDTAEYVALIKKQAASVVRRLPKPDGTAWAPQDIEDLRSDFHSSAAYEHAVLNAHDDESLRKLVYTGLANLVRAELRRTDRGRLHRRLKDLVSSESYLASSARQTAQAVGGGKSAVNDAMNRLKEKFRLVLMDADDDNRRLVLHKLLVLSGESPDS